MNTEKNHSEPVILVLEVSNPTAAEGAAFVALGDSRGELVDHEPLHHNGRDDLHPAIQRLTDRCGISPNALTRIAVSVGPGGYTGLRVAVAAGKLIAECVGAQTVSIPSALVVARSVSAATPRPIGIALASKGDTCHLTIENSTGSVQNFGMLVASQLEALGLGALIADGHLPQSIRDEAGRLGIEVVPSVFSPESACRLAAELEPTSPKDLSVNYAREPDAVTQWRALHPG